MNTKVTGGASEITAAILAWFIDPNATQHCTITGGPGSGKTYMIKELVDTYESFKKLGIGNKLNLQVCGTTNESISIIPTNKDKVRTLYSYLGLVPSKGVIHKRLGSFRYPAIYNPKPSQIDLRFTNIICDESNYIDEDTIILISKWFPNIRIVFIGSKNQLGTGSGSSYIFNQGYDNFLLNTKFRASNKNVQAVYDSSEEDVINQSKPRYIQNDSIIYLNSEDWYTTLLKAYTSKDAHKCITLAHTNKRVFELVGMIRNAQGRPGHYDLAGPTQALHAGSGKIPKKNVHLRKDDQDLTYIPVRSSKGEFLRSYVGESYEHYLYLKSKQHKKIAGEIHPSLVASTQASTIHGAQGGTWDYTFFDLTDLNKLLSWDIEKYRRAKHVGESRHRKKIFIKIN